MMTFTGAWSLSTFAPGYYGTGYRHDGNTNKGAKTATFRPTLPVAGSYEVYERHVAATNYATNVPMDIGHSAGTATVTVNDRLNGGTWNKLGTWNFDAGSNGYARIRTTGTSGHVIADAVKFVKVPDLPAVSVTATDATAGEPGSGQGSGTFTFTRTGSTAAVLTVSFTVGGTATSGSDYTALGTSITFSAGMATTTSTVSVLDDALAEGDETVVLTLAGGTDYTVGSPSAATVTIKDDEPPPSEYVVDDADSVPMMTFTGAWTLSTSAPGYYGTGYRHDGNTNKGAKSATFSPSLPSAGSYDVYERHPASSNYASNVPMDIGHATGTATVAVNQRLNGGTWNKLGTWTFDAGSNGYVRIRTTGTTNHVIADAVKFVAAGSPAPAAPSMADALLVQSADLQVVADPSLLPRVYVWADGIGTDDPTARRMVDGDTNTAWQAPYSAAAWQVGLDFGAPLDLRDVEVLFAGEAWTNLGFVGSEDAQEWYDLGKITNVPVPCQYLFLNMWKDNSRTGAPAIREIKVDHGGQ
jgi:hypothetical protein